MNKKYKYLMKSMHLWQQRFEINSVFTRSCLFFKHIVVSDVRQNGAKLHDL